MPIWGQGEGVKPGTTVYFNATTAPAGYLKENGAAVSRTAYAALFAVIGTTYGAGDGVNTFNLPDSRGEFHRGLDDGRGVDAGRTLGSAQAQDMQPHTHTQIGSTTGTAGTNYQPYGVGTGGTAAMTQVTGQSGTTETRPRNFARLACIKY
ncbi:MAG TPA: phage tail protein [Gallionellaceae bacterium]